MRVLRGRPRLFAGVLCGLVSYPLLPANLRLETRGILAWDIGVTIFLALAFHLFLTQPMAHMQADAKAQEEGEWTVFGLTLIGTIASFAAITGEFSSIKDVNATVRGLHVALVAVTLLVSWLMTHVTFALRYAHEYYSVSDPAVGVDGGLQFPADTTPDYLDFCYFALVLGMTFQVSDVQITSRKLRRLAALHGLLGFLFNTVILALTVNLAAGLL
jgi:uncharacterized membrane protein